MTFQIASMLNANVYDHSVSKIELIETHISWVVLTGEFAYKIKKPVNFGFLDFSTLQKRHVCCDEEIRLNRRLASAIYLDVVAITGTAENPMLAGPGEAFEYAIKMRQFPQSAQLDNMLAAATLKTEHIEALARMAADFHRTATVADASMDFGEAAIVNQPVKDNFIQIKQHLATSQYAGKLSALSSWSEAEFLKLQAFLKQRKQAGFIRECHGDMHLRNLIWLNHQPMAFDCIEFNPHLSWIDVISEIAFLVMDLQSRQQYPLANHFINYYLELTGDYAGLKLINYYLCYRALVRAKVNALRIEQKGISADESQKSRSEFEAYLNLALSYTKKSVPKLIIMQGFSAVGKSTVSHQLLNETGIIRIRSDVERKRLFNSAAENKISSDQSSGLTNNVNSGLYSSQLTQQTYNKLIELAEQIITAGYSVIVDATFLKYQQRQLFKVLAQRLNVPSIILHLTAPAEVLKQRILARKNDVSDADLTVLEYQLANWQALHKEEEAFTINVNTAQPLIIEELKLAIEHLWCEFKAL